MRATLRRNACLDMTVSLLTHSGLDICRKASIKPRNIYIIGDSLSLWCVCARFVFGL